ncbi:type II toxin-antitoxin system RelE family toxin [Streptomyces marincola]|uniref:type II toxin-antitoxin system RelE family toxin n=1 Tax=Streptomyces marincola TaxID=2878388 RepID=UPI001CF1AC45|nr:type II toxin-antitoxin system RelE/ParE family toxin [Streptomyces marincola]UCM91208.1 type II toxin-antitoxin system RelE/ParE family toxin [Streptomyces marincola]
MRWEDTAKRSFARLRKEDRKAADALLDSINLLLKNPRPSGAHPYGPDQFRLRVGFYRVLYRVVSQQPVIVSIEHVG